MSEIVTRAAKSVLRSLLRRSIERFGTRNNDPVYRLISSYLNLLLGNSEDSAAYWKDELFRTVRDSFFYISKQDEEQLDPIKINLRDQIDDQAVFVKLVRDFGVQLKESFWQSFSIQLIFSQPTFVEETDIQFVDPVVKRSDLGRFAVPVHLLDKAEYKIKSDETAKMQKKALTMLLDRVVTQHNNIFVAFRYLCRALVVQPNSETVFNNIVQISGITDQIWKLLETSESAYQLNLKYFLQDLSALFTFIYGSPPKTLQDQARMTSFYEIFNPYYVAICFMKDKDLLKKHKVLSQALFDDIEELDFKFTKHFWQAMILNTLAKTRNLKRISFSQGMVLDNVIAECLVQNSSQLEKIVLTELSSAVDNARLGQLLKALTKLKHVGFEAYGLTRIWAGLPHELESFEVS